MNDPVQAFIARQEQRRALEADLKRYAAECGPEPTVSRFESDLPGQAARWSAWWLEWYRRPLTTKPNSVSS